MLKGLRHNRWVISAHYTIITEVHLHQIHKQYETGNYFKPRYIFLDQKLKIKKLKHCSIC